MWARGLRLPVQRYSIPPSVSAITWAAGQLRKSLTPTVGKIRVPALDLRQLSDNIFTAGDRFGGMPRRRCHRYLYTHRGGKWATSTPRTHAAPNRGSSITIYAAPVALRRLGSASRSGRADHITPIRAAESRPPVEVEGPSSTWSRRGFAPAPATEPGQTQTPVRSWGAT